jgi:hypothetical protein
MQAKTNMQQFKVFYNHAVLRIDAAMPRSLSLENEEESSYKSAFWRSLQQKISK